MIVPFSIRKIGCKNAPNLIISVHFITLKVMFCLCIKCSCAYICYKTPFWAIFVKIIFFANRAFVEGVIPNNQILGKFEILTSLSPPYMSSICFSTLFLKAVEKCGCVYLFICCFPCFRTNPAIKIKTKISAPTLTKKGALPLGFKTHTP